MDIPRKTSPLKRRIRRAAYAVTGVGVIVATTVGLSRLKPARPWWTGRQWSWTP